MAGRFVAWFGRLQAAAYWWFRGAAALRGERGAATAEYALLVTLVALGLVVALGNLREALVAKIQSIINQLNGAQ